jgi:hypothetical protein
MSSKGNKRKRPDAQEPPVDLGLSALLSGHAAQPEHSSPIGPSTDEPHDSTDTSADAAIEQRQLSECEVLFREKGWGELVKLAEAKLAVSDEPEFRLWWVRGHLGAFSMPVSFLAAPLEAVCRRARDNQLAESLRPVLEETGLLALHRLKEVGARDQVESLRDSLFDAGVIDSASEPQPFPASATRRADSAPLPDESLPSPNRLAATIPGERRGQPVRRVAAFAVGVIVAGVIGRWAWTWLHTVFRVPVVIAAENFVSEPFAVDQLIPPLERRDPVGSLSALFYSIETPEAVVPAAQKDAPPAGDGQGGGQVTTQTMHPPVGAASRAPTTQERPPSAEGRKEQINTRSPVEGPEVKERLRRRETHHPPEPARGPFSGVPEPSSSPPVMENRSTDVFDPGGVYRVLVRTSVLEHPSYSADVVGTLEPGDRVFVESKMGRWVRLRSKRGRGGFVLAEDVAEVYQDRYGR